MQGLDCIFMILCYNLFEMKEELERGKLFLETFFNLVKD